jgi:hypothetical protein
MWWLYSIALAVTWPEITPVDAGTDGSHDAAVVVGIENYMLVDDIPGARTNAEDWFRWLTKTRGISPGRVHLLRDIEGTKEKIERYAAQAAGEAGAGGTVWFVFVGHGAPTFDGQDGVLVGADAQSEPDSLYARSVKRSDLLLTLTRGAHAQTVVVLDTCFSGQSGRGSLMTGLQPAIPSYALTSVPQATVLTAGTATQFAGPLPQAGRPAFSYLLLGAMTGWGDADGNGEVTAAEAVAYTNEAISATVKGRQQTPELAGKDLVLATGARDSGPDLAELVLQSGPPRQAPLTTDPELDARLIALREAQQAQMEADKRQAARQAALAEAVREELTRKALVLKAEATSAWAALAGTDDREAILAFARTYGAATVQSGDAEQQVRVAEVDLARDWLEGLDAPRFVSAPEAWDRLSGDHAAIPLWRPLGRDWRDGLAADPQQIWLPYLMLGSYPKAIEWHTCGACEEREATLAEADAMVLDAVTLAEAWLTSTDSEQMRKLEFALNGLVLEAQELYQWRSMHMLFEKRGVGFKDPDAFSLYGASYDDTLWQLLYWAFLEVQSRAETTSACEGLLAKLDKLTTQAKALGPDGVRDEGAFYKLYRKGAKLSEKVHACADEALFEALSDTY